MGNRDGKQKIRTEKQLKRMQDFSTIELYREFFDVYMENVDYIECYGDECETLDAATTLLKERGEPHGES